jgi:hypothetical protein
MTYTEMTTLYRNKARGYTADQCEFAVRDIHETLRLYFGDHMDNPYVVKLYCELDAVRDRLAHLQRKHN